MNHFNKSLSKYYPEKAALFKLTIFIICFFIFSNCSKTNPLDSVDDPDLDPPRIVDVTLNLDGAESLDFGSLTLVTPSDTLTVNDDGLIEGVEEPTDFITPLLFADKEDNIILGYFPHTLENDQISIKEVVYFFVKTYPGISILDLDDEVLKASLLDSDKYDILSTLVTNALNQNASVIDNSEFDEVVREFLNELNDDNSTQKKDVVAQFKVEYERNGRINLPTEAPIFSAFGAQIYNQNGTTVYEPKLLSSKSVILSPGSFVDFIIENIYEEPDAGTDTLTLTDDGIYEIYFTNGKGSRAVDQLVTAQNEAALISMALGYIFPLATKKWMQDRGCDDVLFTIIEDIAKPYFESLSKNEAIDEEDLIKFLKNISANTTEYIACNAISTLKQKYYKLLFKYVEKRLKIAEDVVQLIFQIRDSYGSDIQLSETRYFDSDISYGNLYYSSLEEVIQQQPGTTFTYEGLAVEESISYDVERGLSSSTFIKKTDTVSVAADIPFGVEWSGDAEIDLTSSVIRTDESGIIKIEGTMGSAPSELRLSPLVSNKSNINDVNIIQLIPSTTRLFTFQEVRYGYDLIEIDLNEFEITNTIAGRLPNPTNYKISYRKTSNEILMMKTYPPVFYKINIGSGEVQDFEYKDGRFYEDGKIFSNLAYSNSADRLFTFEDTEDPSGKSRVYLTELSPNDLRVIQRVTVIDNWKGVPSGPIAVNEQSKELLGVNQFNFLKINFVTGNVQLFDLPKDFQGEISGHHPNGLIYFNTTGRLFTVEIITVPDGDGGYSIISYLTELNPNDFSRLDRITELPEAVLGTMGVDESTNEIYVHTGYSTYHKINVDTGVFETFELGAGRFGSVVLTN